MFWEFGNQDDTQSCLSFLCGWAETQLLWVAGRWSMGFPLILHLRLGPENRLDRDHSKNYAWGVNWDRWYGIGAYFGGWLQPFAFLASSGARLGAAF